MSGSASTLGITIEDNTFLNSPADAIAIQQGVVTGNYFSGEGYVTGAHGDAIYVPDTTGPITITNNFIDETPNAGRDWAFQHRHSHYGRVREHKRCDRFRQLSDRRWV